MNVALCIESDKLRLGLCYISLTAIYFCVKKVLDKNLLTYFRVINFRIFTHFVYFFQTHLLLKQLRS